MRRLIRTGAGSKHGNTDSRSSLHSFSLREMLVVPFILQVAAVVGLVGYLSYRNGQRAVEDLTSQLMAAVGNRVEKKLTSYLQAAQTANQINSDAVQRGALDLSLEQPTTLQQQHLWQQMQLFPNLSWITLGAEGGASLGIWRPGAGQPLQFSIVNRSTDYYGTYYAIQPPGKPTAKLKVERPEYYARSRPWYREAIAAQRAIWTSIYAGFTPGTVFIAASQPLYDPTGKLVGVSGTDISLLAIQDFLVENTVSPTGQVFLIERSGLLVASSSQEAPFQTTAGQPQRVNALESSTPLIRATAESMRQQLGEFQSVKQRQKFQFQLNQQQQFVQVLPFSMQEGLDWLIVIVVPASDVMAEIQAGTLTTIALCLAALIAAVGVNIWISRKLVKPIVKLSQASQQIALGNFAVSVQASKIREISTLADSFTRMNQQIQQSRQQLEDYSRSLEQKVNDRTQALQQEIQQRLAAEVALQAANQTLQQLAYLDGLTQIANRRQFDERLLLEWRQMKREQLPLSLILCDVDFFKQYNDTYGHQAGDDCLRQVAQVLAANARRPFDLAARYGGEEFAMILPNTPLAGAEQVAALIRDQINYLEIPHCRSEVSPYVTLSFGVTNLMPTEATRPDQLLLQVDRALYQAKLTGRNRIVVG